MSARYCAQCGYVPYTCSHLDGSQPSPVSASAGTATPQLSSTAAGDQLYDYLQLKSKLAERDATIARLEAEKLHNWKCYTAAEGRATRAELDNARRRAALQEAADALATAARKLTTARDERSAMHTAVDRDKARAAAGGV